MSIALAEKHATVSLEPIWAAYLRTEKEKVESAQDSSRSPDSPIPSPYYAHLSDFAGQGAGIEHAFLNAQQNLQDPQSLNPYSYAV